MLVKQLDHEGQEIDKFFISYLDKNESMFLLGLLKSVPCTHCPDFFQGCDGGPTLQEAAMMSDKEYVDRRFNGTEEFLCGKLRNIISLNKAEEQELNNNFENSFNRRVSVLTRKANDQQKYVLINDRDELSNIIKDVERQMIEKLQHDVDRVTKHNISLINDLQQKITQQNNVIEEMQETIKRLKRQA